MKFGQVGVTSAITLETKDFLFAATQLDKYHFRCSVKPFGGKPEAEKIEKELFQSLHDESVVELNRKLDSFFGQAYYSLRSLLADQRMSIISLLTREAVDKVGAAYEQLYEDNQGLNEIYHILNLPVPEVIGFSAQYALNRILFKQIVQALETGFNAGRVDAVHETHGTAKKYHVRIEKEKIATYLYQQMTRRAEGLLKRFDPELVRECLQIQKLAQELEIELNVSTAQNHVFNLLRERNGRWSGLSDQGEKLILELARAVHINPSEINSKLEKVA